MKQDAWGRPEPELIPMMTRSEHDLLRSQAARSKRILEYGSGGSTAMFMEETQAVVVSVESDPVWVERLDKELPYFIEQGRLLLHYADVGPVGLHGSPTDMSTMSRWPDYWQWPWTSIYNTPDYGPDLVFVDGRFRISCALYSALRVGPGVTILFHDFWRRRRYDVLQRHLRIVASSGQMVAFLPRADINEDAVRNDLAAYRRDRR
jgi:hypothetical protein